MAKSKKKVKKNSNDLFKNEFTWILIIFFSIFTTLSIYTHSYLDPSFNRTSSESVKNIFGLLGSYFSDILFQFFGSASYSFPIFLFSYIVKKIIFPKEKIFFYFFISSILSLVTIASIISLSKYGNGGILGIFFANTLTSFMNEIGSYIFLSLILCSLIIFMFRIPIFMVIGTSALMFVKSITYMLNYIKKHFSDLKENDEMKKEREELKKQEKLQKEKERISKKEEKLKQKSEREEIKEKTKKKKIKEIEENFSDKNESEEEKKEKVEFNTYGIEEKKERKKIFSNFFNKTKNAENLILDRPQETNFVMYGDNKIIDDVFNEKFEDTPPPIKENDINIKTETKEIKNNLGFETQENKNSFKDSEDIIEDKEKDIIISSGKFKQNKTNKQKSSIKIQVSKSDYKENEQEELPKKDKNKIYTLPPLKFLKYEKPEEEEVDTSLLSKNADMIKETLDDFKISDTEITEIFKGPTLTTYELSIPRGVKISKVTKFSDEVASVLKVPQVRMVPIHEKGVIGVEVPNTKREIVWLKEILNTQKYKKEAEKSKLTVVLGKDISGEAIVANLAKMPHLLIAGTTGSGKSVFTNVLVTSILYNATPDEVKFILIDPKMLEFSIYNDIPNLLFPVIIDPKKAAYALNWAVDEMERRYGLISEFSQRDIVSYNKKAKKMIEEGIPKEIQYKIDELESIKLEIKNDDSLSEMEIENELLEINKRIEKISSKYKNPEVLPYIVIVLDEYADLMMVASKDVETSIARIAQKARAAGIHLVIATQRPDKDVVTGIIKANLPVRIALSVKGSTNSKIILDETGAEKLLGYGDMLYLGPGTSQLKRIQSPLITSDEQNNILDFLKVQGSPSFDLDVLEQYNTEEDEFDTISEEDKDEKYEDAIKIAVEMKKVSASYLQRRLKLGYNRAARIVEVMEKEGIVGPPNGSKPRELIKIPDNYL